MKRYQCIRDILDCFDFYEKYTIRADRAGWFRGLLYGWKPSRQITRPVGLCHYETRQSVFRRAFRAYVFRAVREAREAGIDYLTICYALCRKISSAAAAGEDTVGDMSRFSMHAYVRKLRRSERKYLDKFENVLATSVRAKIDFLRDQRRQREQERMMANEYGGFHIEFPGSSAGYGKGRAQMPS